MKRYLSLLLAALLLLSLLSACGGTKQIEEMPELPLNSVEAYHFTRENLPRLDGSTSTAHMATASGAVEVEPSNRGKFSRVK